MAAKPKLYQRLPGRGRRRQGFASFAVSAQRTRLWLGPDHLLSVDTQWYSQDYRRFYYRDIQAIIIRKTIGGKIINLVMAVLAGLTLSAVFVTTEGARVFWIIMASVFTFFLILNSLFGPTSRCHLQTAVQREELPSLGRLWRARKVLARIRPLIIEAQGQLTSADIPAQMAGADGSPVTAPPPEAPLTG